MTTSWALPLASGDFGYLVIWTDLFSRKIVGWQVEVHMEESLVIKALEKGLESRKPASGLILHSATRAFRLIEADNTCRANSDL